MIKKILDAIHITNEEILEQFITNMIETGQMNNGMDLILAQVRREFPRKYDSDQKVAADELNSSMIAIYNKFPIFCNVLINPASVLKTNPLQLDFSPTSSSAITPIGSTRLKIIQMFICFVKLNYWCINDLIIKKSILPTCIEFIFKYPKNNFLHRAVGDLIVAILCSDEDELKHMLFKQCDLLTRIAGSLTSQAALSSGFRAGWTGYLIYISNEIEKVKFNSDTILEYTEKHKWIEFKNSILKTFNSNMTGYLGGEKPVRTVLPQNVQKQLPEIPQKALPSPRI